MTDIKLFAATFPTRLRQLRLDERTELVKRCWPTADLASLWHDDATFFDHLENEVDRIKHQQERFAVDTLEGVIVIIDLMKRATPRQLSELVQALKYTYPDSDEKAIQRSLELCIRLWLTLNINSPSLAVGSTSRLEIPMTWRCDLSIKDLVQSRWNDPRGRKSTSETQIDDAFTAAYLVNVCGMSLQWTEYLSDHLTIDPQRKVLTLYKYKVYLRNRIMAKDEHPLPGDLVEEALDTLNLLLPFPDPATKKLLARHGQLGLYQYGTLARGRKLDLGAYRFWREELETLAETFSRPPQTWKQLATDRRNLMDWAAFWVTAMVAVMTLVSVPCNLIQATYSVRAYNVAVAEAKRCEY